MDHHAVTLDQQTASIGSWIGRSRTAGHRFTEDEIMARARKLADEQRPGWEVILEAERVGKEAFLRQQTAIMGRPDSRPGLARIASHRLMRPSAIQTSTHDRNIAE